MGVSERIRELRKNHLKISQTAFGERLGVSRSVINNIESGVLARPDQKLSLIKLMCKEFSVREEWLLEGKEPMLVESDTFSLDEFAKSQGATDFEIEVIKAYFKMSPDIRQQVISHFKKCLSLTQADNSAQETLTDEEDSFKTEARKVADGIYNDILETRDFQTPESKTG